MEAMCDALGLEFYIGLPRDKPKSVPTFAINGDDFATIPLYTATASAGPGSRNDTEEVERHLMFRRDWMRGLNVSLDHAKLLRARGDSMHPVIHDGDLMMIDTSRNRVPLTSERRRRSIWVIRDDQDGDIRVKWLDRPEGSTIIVSSQDADTHPPQGAARQGWKPPQPRRPSRLVGPFGEIEMATCTICNRSGLGFLEVKEGRRPSCRRAAELADAQDNDVGRLAREQAHRDAVSRSPDITLTTETHIGDVERLGIVAAEIVLGMNIFKDVLANLRDIFGGRSGVVQNTLRDAREAAFDELRLKAAALGADAVIAIDIDYHSLSTSMASTNRLVVAVSGTAIRFKPA